MFSCTLRKYFVLQMSRAGLAVRWAVQWLARHQCTRGTILTSTRIVKEETSAREYAYILTEFVLPTVIKLPSACRTQDPVGAAMDDCNSGKCVSYRQSSRRIIWAYGNNGFDAFGPEMDHHNSSMLDCQGSVYLNVERVCLSTY